MSNKRLISFRRLDAYLRLVCESSESKARTKLHEDIGRILAPKTKDARRHFTRLIDAGDDTRLIDVETGRRILAAIHGEKARIDEEKIVSSWQPQSSAVVHLPKGSAVDGEIEVLDQLSDKNLVPSPIDRWVGVYVDRVRFWKRWSDDGRPQIEEGHYVRIETPGRTDGAVVLPVDGKTGDVCLVTQFRHAPRRLLTEAPRGFADPGIDKDAIDTARRELLEETQLGTTELVRLKRTYTDTGKLADQPSLFLAIVNRDRHGARYTATKPLMLDPVWVPLLEFYAAVFATDEHGFSAESIEFVDLGPHQAPRIAKSDLAKGYLAIEDGFTIQAALLALPRLRKRFPELFASRTGPWD